MFRSTALTSLAVLAAVAATPLAARAQSGAAYAAPGVGNVVGGGGATMYGGGDDAVVLYSPSGAGGGASFAQPGRSARFVGAGDGPEVEYLEPVPGAGRGREAWLIGGGDNAEVVYESPRRR